jgi:hypothetical protein
MIPMTAPVTAVIERETTLDHLARDIEREICGIDNAAHEAQVAREDIGLVGDEVAMRRAGVDTGYAFGLDAAIRWLEERGILRGHRRSTACPASARRCRFPWNLGRDRLTLKRLGGN